jgi:hypothetical protein
VDIEPLDNVILGIRISLKEQFLLLLKDFPKDLVRKYGRHSLSTDGGGHGTHKLVDF